MSEEQRKELELGWVSVKDSLPEDRTLRCLVVFGESYGMPQIGIATRSVPWKGELLWSGHGGSHNDVTHWMPLPPSPKEPKP